MRRPPSLDTIARYPVTAAIGLSAIGVTLAWLSGKVVSFAYEDYHIWQGEYWRILTSALPHVNVLHLVFNVYWLWVFGTLVEGVFGHLQMAGLVLLFAAGSSAAEYALLDGGVGLSGVGYGLSGLLWVLAYNDERLTDAIDGQTISLFVGWFFVCIVLTYTKLMPVANVAHGVGALLGVLTGLAIASQGGLRLLWAGLLSFTVACSLLGATFARPYVNLSPNAANEFAFLAYLELEAHRDENAVDLLRHALKRDDRQAGWWYNLGIAYQRLDRKSEAVDAYHHAIRLEPDNKTYKNVLAHPENAFIEP